MLKNPLKLSWSSRTTWTGVAAVITAVCGLLGADEKTIGLILAIEAGLAAMFIREAMKP